MVFLNFKKDVLRKNKAKEEKPATTVSWGTYGK